MRLRTAIVGMAVAFVLAVLLITAYLTSGCHLGDPSAVIIAPHLDRSGTRPAPRIAEARTHLSRPRIDPSGHGRRTDHEWLWIGLKVGELEVLHGEQPWASLNVDPDMAGFGLWAECLWVASKYRVPGVRRNTRMLRGQLSAETGDGVLCGPRRHSDSMCPVALSAGPVLEASGGSARGARAAA